MTLQDRIEELLAEAAPLRELDEDDPAKAPLAGLVDQINALRAEQASAPAHELLATIVTPVEGADAQPKRGPGRPKKADK